LAHCSATTAPPAKVRKDEEQKRYGLLSNTTSTFDLLLASLIPYVSAAPSLGSSSSSECGSGTFSSSPPTSCSICSSGSYSSASANPSCTSCPEGKYNDEDTTTAANHNALFTCSGCPIGTFSNTPGASSSSTCTTCPQGSYTNTISTIVCTVCPAGRFNDDLSTSPSLHDSSPPTQSVHPTRSTSTRRPTPPIMSLVKPVLLVRRTSTPLPTSPGTTLLTIASYVSQEPSVTTSLAQQSVRAVLTENHPALGRPRALLALPAMSALGEALRRLALLENTAITTANAR